MKTDIEIAQSAKMKPIGEIAQQLGLSQDDISYYGKYKAKVSLQALAQRQNQPDGKLVLVTAINPTPAGEGKTTTTVGLGQAMNRIGKRCIIALREPSLGPVMGVKGGAAGGGYAQVVPMEDINLHFTGDMHAITSAHNLLSALIDNHIKQGNELQIDPAQIVWKRVLDMNDRALRQIVVGLGGKVNGVPREDGFMITVASEVMAILCLASSMADLKARLARIIVAYTYEGKPVTAQDLHAEGAMTLLLKDALQPNLVQTLENTPCLMHGGPFANIAHGCNSLLATKLALKLGDYVITEAGFGADLGAEKFLDIKCRYGGLKPDAIVLVATVRALKYNGGVKKADLKQENVEALRAGIGNLEKHIENMRGYGVPVVVALNVFDTDTQAELSFVRAFCEKMGVQVAYSEVFAKGGAGGEALAHLLVKTLEEQKSNFHFLYDTACSIREKLDILVKKLYGGAAVAYTPMAEKKIKQFEKMGRDNLPVCVAKTQYSLSDDPSLLGRPSGFTVTVRDINLSNGAGFLVALTGDIMTMPGLPKVPAANSIDIDENGTITGLF